MTDPYSVLGITPSADDETIKKAYRKKCKEYHPDLHPDDPSAEEHFKEVQAAYSEIMRIKQGGGASYSAGGQRYGSSQSGYSQQYQDPFSGAGFGFGPFGFGYYSTSGSSGRQSYGSAAGDPELRAAANYIRSGFYEEAMNTLNGIPTANRTAQWHYYAALANQGLSGIQGLCSSDETVSGVHGDTADRIVADLLCHLNGQLRTVVIDFNGVQQRRQLVVSKPDVQYGAGDLHYLTNVFFTHS